MMISTAIEDTRERTYDGVGDMRACLAKIRAKLKGRPNANSKQALAEFDNLSTKLWTPPPLPAAERPNVRLDSSMRLDNFAVHDGAFMAHAAMTQAANGLGAAPTFNPLFIHAGSGQGKTHLLQGTVAAAREKHKDTRPLYLSAEAFLYSNQSYRLVAYPLVAIDDVHVIARSGPRDRARLHDAVDALIVAGRQVVLASSVSVADLEYDVHLDARLRARIDAGLTLPIGLPDRDGRAAILRRQLDAIATGHDHGAFAAAVGDDIIAAIAAAGPASPRQLGAVLTSLHADHVFAGKAPSVERAMQIVAELERPDPAPPRIEMIIRVVAEHYKVARADILSSRRTANVVRPRQVAMYLAKTLTHRSLPEIGRRFGGRDHTTVLHAVRKIGALVETDAVLAADIAAIKEKLGA